MTEEETKGSNPGAPLRQDTEQTVLTESTKRLEMVTVCDIVTLTDSVLFSPGTLALASHTFLKQEKLESL